MDYMVEELFYFCSFLVFIAGVRLLRSRFNLNFIMSNTHSANDQTSVVSTTLFEKVFNPYTLAVIDSKEQISLNVTSDQYASMYVAWGVLISEVYPLINLSSQTISDDAYLSEELSKISLSFEKHTIVNDKETIRLQKLHIDLGPVPRDRYPLAVFIISSGRSSSTSQDYNKIMGSLSFIHVKDSICAAETHIFDQYVKTADSKLHNIKPIYVSSEETNDSVENESTSESHTCSLCMTGVITRVLLPCRHACMCDDCLHKVIHCPVCRCAIVSTFNM